MTSFNRFFKAWDFIPRFFKTWDKVTASIIGLSWLIRVYHGFDIIYGFRGTVLDRGTLSLSFDLCFCKVSDVRFS